MKERVQHYHRPAIQEAQREKKYLYRIQIDGDYVPDGVDMLIQGVATQHAIETVLKLLGLGQILFDEKAAVIKRNREKLANN